MTDRTDVAVVGLGAMGAATLYQLAKRGIRAVGVDRFVPPHAQGSSHGETRITRCAAGEGGAYPPLAMRSHEIWRSLEAETGQTLLEACGVLVMGEKGRGTHHHGQAGFLARTAALAERHWIPHAQLDAAGIEVRFPAFRLTGREEAYFEPGGGFVHPERCLAALLGRAGALGAEIRTGTAVLAIEPAGAAMRLVLDGADLIADRVVVAAGAWSGRLLGPPFRGKLVPYRQVLHWFPVDDPGAYAPGTFPSYIWMHGDAQEDYFYGFPALSGSGEVKAATERYDGPCEPDTMTREVAPAEAADMYRRHVSGRLRGARPPSRSVTCLYTVTPDAGFVIDFVPGNDRVLVISACSGHGFKHAAAIGEAVAERLGDGRSAIDLGAFSLDRLGAPQPV